VLAEYLELRASLAVTRDLAQRALAWAQPFAMQALGIHTQRQTLVDGELPAYVVTTTPETNIGILLIDCGSNLDYTICG